MVKAAGDTAKSKDYDGAHSQLELARERAGAIMLNPQGEKMTSRKNLMGDNKRWRAAVVGWNKAWADLKDVLEKESQDSKVDASALKKVNQLLTTLSFRYNLNAFGMLLATLSNPNTPRKEGLATREAALRIVRQYQTALLKSPSRADLIDGNPFDGVKAKAGAAERELLYALESLHGNVLRSVG